MAKLSYSKLKLKIKTEIKTIKYNDCEIEVKTYLPIAEKMMLIANVVQSTIDNPKFINPIKQDVCLKIEIVKQYTNINFTEKQLEDAGVLYDELINSGLLGQVLSIIGEAEFNYLVVALNTVIESIWKYNNSALGIMEELINQAQNLNMDVEKLQETVSNPENLQTIKNVLTKLS